MQTRNGNLVLEPIREEWIPYKTVSDALIADLSLSHNVSLATLDLFLAVVSDTAFNPGHITFERATDIDARISEHRREQLAVSLYSHGSGRECAGMPLIVLERVAEYMFDYSPGLNHVLMGWSQDELSLRYLYSNSDLLRMSTVHRSWTCIIQQFL